MRIIVTLFTLLLFALGVGFVAHSIVQAQEVQGSQTLAHTYTFPFAGIGPDNPLYPLKEMRDSMWVFFTRDHNKKAELLLMISDKKIVMAQQLADKGDWKRAVETAQDSERDVSRLLRALESAQKIGYAPSEDFIRKAKQSSDSHLKIMKNLMKNIDPTMRKDLEAVMEENVRNFNMLK